MTDKSISPQTSLCRVYGWLVPDAAGNHSELVSVTVVICPGIHSQKLTHDFLREFVPSLLDVVVFPTDRYPAYSAWHLIQFLDAQRRESSLGGVKRFFPVLFVGFSAGVVAAIAAAWYWQLMGRSVKALVAIDGWGVPLYGNFPIHRMSHDWFTHWSSTMGEQLGDCFYADPAVEHLDLWRSPVSVQGRWVNYAVGRSSSSRGTWCSPISRLSVQTTAADFLRMLLIRYGEGSNNYRTPRKT